MGDQWELYNQDYLERVRLGRPMGWENYENCITRITLGGLRWGNQWDLYNPGYIVGPMRWGTNENRVVLIGGTNEMGDQWDGGPLGLAENGWTNEKGDQWEGGPMSSNNVVGDLWIGAPMRRGPMIWGTNESGGPMRWGTNEMSGAWVLIGGPMRWGTNEMGGQWDGEPMRWGTNEMGDQWCAPDMCW